VYEVDLIEGSYRQPVIVLFSSKVSRKYRS